MKKLEYEVLVKLKDQINSSLSKIKGSFDDIKKKVDANSSAAERFNDILKKTSWMEVYAGIEVLKNVADGFNQLSGSGMQFQQGIADLSSITGIAGKQLQELEGEARKFGIVSGKGAAGAADSYATLASQIDVATIGISGLNELQARTVTLAQAAGMGMNDAALALSGTINQFGLSADQANRVINVLAAGSKFGAANISELSQSFKVVGATANAAGLSVEQTAGALEVLSKNNLKGAEAGTALRNILLKMQTELGLDLGETGVAAALEALKPKLSDATYLSKLFGMENVAAAQFMIANAEAVEQMTQKVTETNVAQEQASIRMNTTQARMEQMKARVDDMKISFFNLTGGVSAYIGVAAEQVVMVAQMLPLLTKVGGAISWLTKLENLKTIAVGASIAATKAMAIAQGGLNAVMSANPIGIVIAALTALGVAITIAWNKSESFRRVVLGTWEAIKSFGETLIKTVVTAIKLCVEGLGALGSAISSLFKGEFAKAGEHAKEGVKKIAAGMAGLNPVVTVGIAYQQTDFKDAYEKGAAKATKKEPLQQGSNDVVTTTVTPVNINFDDPKNGKGVPIRVLPKIDIAALKSEIKGVESVALPEINTEGLDIPIQRFSDLTEKIWGTESAIGDMNRNMSSSLTNMIGVIREFAIVSKKDLGNGIEKTTMQMQGMSAMMQGMAGIMGGLSGAVGDSASAWLSWGANLLSMVATAIPQLLALFGVQSALAVSEQAKLPFPLNVVAMGATVAGIAAAVMSIPKPTNFAEGGVIYGETFARVGEYAGASNNPEVIAPLSKLRSLISDSVGGGGGDYREWRLRGRDLVAVQSRNNRYSKRRGK
ncbi:MAG: phage tail tape measure protein [Bacteroidales bacterium]